MYPSVILCGQTGAGKSSLVNMIAGRNIAPTSPDLTTCTFGYHQYDIQLEEGLVVTLWDTAGLNQGFGNDNDTIRGLCELFISLEKHLILLIFCLRGKISAGTTETYTMFKRLCPSTVPMVAVVTGLEKEQNKTDWWSKNEIALKRAGMNFSDHACITGIKGHAICNSGKFAYDTAYTQSTQDVKSIIKRVICNYPAKPTDRARREWLGMVLGFIRKLFLGTNEETVDVAQLKQMLKKLGLAEKDCEKIIQAYKKPSQNI